MDVHVLQVFEGLINQGCVEVVVLRELGAVGLVEVLVDVSLCSVVLLQLVVGEHGQTVERRVARFDLQTCLSGLEGILEMTGDVDVSGDSIDILIGAHGLHVLQFLGCL